MSPKKPGKPAKKYSQASRLHDVIRILEHRYGATVEDLDMARGVRVGFQGHQEISHEHQPWEMLRMATPRKTGPTDAASQRCVDCGHPRREHHGPVGCTVPKCTCTAYKLPDTEASTATRSA